MRKQHRRAQVDIERAIDLIAREALEPSRRGYAGVGDQDVDLSGLLEEAIDLGGVAEIDGERARLELLGERLEHVGSPTGEDQLSAEVTQRPRDRLAQAAAGARDEHG